MNPGKDLGHSKIPSCPVLNWSEGSRGTAGNGFTASLAHSHCTPQAGTNTPGTVCWDRSEPHTRVSPLRLPDSAASHAQTAGTQSV